ncbi:MAG: sulfate ABC transporter substrate-binding protein [Clostridiales Family XIII bacterium]|jgi:sulfate transport system substrate-binding protein|nr:sulfate ABC transporter substrate-binding protein [Clostridiales Family XIII bacterium]
MKIKKISVLVLTLSLALSALAGCSSEPTETTSGDDRPAEVEILNVSYDPTRELYVAFNEAFAKYWKETTGQEVVVTQSHAGSGKQANAVIEGNEADVVTLALEGDVDAIRKAGLINDGWVDRLPLKSSPYTSTIVFLVRKGNPKNIKDWDDIVKSGVEVITPSPKTSGGAKWNFLAAWAFAQNLYNGDDAKITQFVKDLYANVTVLDSGARGSTTTFVENKQGDVLLAWENEAFLSQKEHPGEYEIVTPSISILAQPSVSVVDTNADKHGTREVSEAYLQYLYTEEAQRIEGTWFYRPSNETILKEFSDIFDLNVKLVNIDDDFGGWDAANTKFFVDGAVFDQIYKQ